MKSDVSMLIKITDRLKLAIKPILKYWERLGLVESTLVATCDFVHEWHDDEDEIYKETITFYLFSYPSGQRYFKVHEYGMCDEACSHERYLKDILTWEYGGPLPRGAKRVGAADIVTIVQPTIQVVE